MTSDLNISHEKISDCFISIVWVHFTYKTENFRFWESLKYPLIVFAQIKLCEIWTCLAKQCLIWFKPPFSSSVLTIGGEIRILNCFEIVKYFSIMESVFSSKFVLFFLFLSYLEFFGITIEILFKLYQAFRNSRSELLC